MKKYNDISQEAVDENWSKIVRRGLWGAKGIGKDGNVKKGLFGWVEVDDATFNKARKREGEGLTVGSHGKFFHADPTTGLPFISDYDLYAVGAKKTDAKIGSLKESDGMGKYYQYHEDVVNEINRRVGHVMAQHAPVSTLDPGLGLSKELTAMPGKFAITPDGVTIIPDVIDDKGRKKVDMEALMDLKVYWEKERGYNFGGFEPEYDG